MQVSKSQFDNDVEDYQALVTASPILYPTMQHAVMSNLTTSGDTDVHILLTFHAVFWERPVQSQS
jgi:hypothetical protein